MSKTITIPNRHGDLGINGDVIVNVDDFAAFAARVQSGETLTAIPNRWSVAALCTFDETGKVVLTPRGEDLLASAHLIPDDPKPEQPSAPPCEACNGKCCSSARTCATCATAARLHRARGVRLLPSSA